MEINASNFFREATMEINSSLDIEKSIARCLRYLKKFMPVDEIRLSLLELDLSIMKHIAVATIEGGEKLDRVTSLSHDLVTNIHEGPEVKIVNDPSSEPVSKYMLRSLFKNYDYSLLIIRLKIEGQRIGNLILQSNGRGKYKESHGKLLSLLNEPFAMALSNALRYQEINKLKDMLTDDNLYLQRELLRQSGEEIIGANSGIKRVMEMVNNVASLNCPVLILGETGVGKELIANAIHHYSPRKDAPLIKVNCGAIPETLLDTELFGHERGAFTGAIRQQRGRFERAQKGTIFLDEIGELPHSAQVKMLRVLQNKEFERVGGSHVITADIRVVASTHRDLEQMVRSNLFREDLFFRLNVFPIRVPALRERIEDIPALVHHFIERKSMEMKLQRKPAIAPGAIDSLMTYHWPGNVRELENVVERSLILNKKGLLEFEHIISEPRGNKIPILANQTDKHFTLDEAISHHIKIILEVTNGKVQGPAGAASLLGINPSTLRARMRKLGIPYGRRIQYS